MPPTSALGAYGAALLLQGARRCRWKSALVARAAARPRSARCVFGWFCVRLSGVYLAMLTLAFAQIVWSVVFQWDEVTGGSNGLLGIWPSPGCAASGVLLPHALLSRSPACCCCARMLFAPFGYAMRAGRDSPLRADAIGIDVQRMQWVALRDRRRVRRPGRRAVRVLEGHDLARDARRRQLGRRPRDGAARRRADARGAAGRRARCSPGCRTRSRARPTTGGRCSAASILLLVLRFPQGIAGFVKRRCDPAMTRVAERDPAVEAAPRRGSAAAAVAASSRSPSAACRRSTMSASTLARRRAAGADRPERRRQDRPASTWSTAS